MTIHFKYLIGLFLLIGIVSKSSADEGNLTPIFKNYTKELPSSEVYDIYQDKTGIIWIATDRGIAKFNTQKFIGINTRSYFQSRIVFKIKEEAKDKVWILTKDNEFYWFNPLSDETVFTPYPFNDTLISYLSKPSHKINIRKFVFSDIGLNVSFKSGVNALNIDSIGNAHFLESLEGSHSSHLKSSLVLKMNNGFPYTKFIEKTTHELLLEDKSKLTPLIEKFEYNDLLTYGVSRFVTNKKDTLFSICNYLFLIRNGEVKTKDISHGILDIHADSLKILVSTYNGVYALDKDMNETNVFLKNYSVSSILKDNRRGFWFTTLEQGIFYTSSLDLKLYNNLTHIIPTDLFQRNEYIICNNNNLEIIVLDQKKRTIEKYDRTGNNELLYRSKRSNLGPFLGTAVEDEYKDGYYYITDLTKKYLYCCNKSIRVFDKSGGFQTFTTDTIPSINHSVQIDSNKYLLATKKGLYELTNNTEFKKRSLQIMGDELIKRIIPFKPGLLFQTNDGLILERNDKTTLLINEQKGLKFNHINGVFKSNDTTVWVYSHKGIDKIIFSETDYYILNYPIFDGLPSQEVTSFLITDNTVFIGTKAGLCRLPKNALVREPVLDPNAFVIDSIKSESGLLLKSDTLICVMNKKTSFYFNYLDFSEKNIQIDYRFSDVSDWINITSNYINFFPETGGEFKLDFQVRYANETLLFDALYIIYVPTPFYKTIWFISLFFILICSLLFLLIYSHFKRVGKRKEEKLKLELELITSRMNPHFTFNTISSIQYYVLNSDKNKAIEYLSDFALLMRKTLEYSYKENISLATELDFLNLYIDLENKRYKSNFYLEVEMLSQHLSSEILIPPLLLQPLIENTLIHAEYNNEDDKKIQLTIKDLEKKIEFTLRDFGRITPKKTRLKKHKSIGLELIQNRTRLYNHNLYNVTDFVTTMNPAGEPGFEVKICLKK